MLSYRCLLVIQLFNLALIFAPTTLAFSSLPLSLSEPAHRLLNCNGRLFATDGEAEEDEVQPKAEYGVSYIGGDPCGSKYNDDPFDVQVTKPGMPDDMKARIQALVDKKVAEEKSAAESTTKD